MNMYNIVHGTNPLASALMAALNLSTGEVGRFRDCYLSKHEDGVDAPLEIHVYTRNGGGNREAYEAVTKALRARPDYLGDEDDSFDCTYATYRFSIPEHLREPLAGLVEAKPEIVPASPQERFQAFMDLMKANPEDPAVQRVVEVVRPTLEAAIKATEGG